VLTLVVHLQYIVTRSAVAAAVKCQLSFLGGVLMLSYHCDVKHALYKI